MDKARLSWIISGLEWDSLTEWESRFIESVEAYFKRHGDLTEAQANKLEEIFKDKSR